MKTKGVVELVAVVTMPVMAVAGVAAVVAGQMAGLAWMLTAGILVCLAAEWQR